MEAPMQVNIPYYLSPWRKPLTIKTSFGYSYGSEVRGVGWGRNLPRSLVHSRDAINACSTFSWTQLTHALKPGPV